MINQLISAANIAVNPNVESRRQGPVLYALSPGSDITLTVTAPDQLPGQEYIIFVNTISTTSRTLTFGSGFRVTGTLATGTTNARTFAIRFVSDGQNLVEVGRTGAIT